jgi:hypothetical protein
MTKGFPAAESLFYLYLVQLAALIAAMRTGRQQFAC